MTREKVGAEGAAQRLMRLPEFKGSKVVKVNPDTPQAPVRGMSPSKGKLLII